MYFRILIILVSALALIGCDAQLTCELCGGSHDTGNHITEAMNGPGGVEDPQIMAADELLLLFVLNRRRDGFVQVNGDAYRSAVSDKNINVFVSNFALLDYLKTKPDAESSDGMIPRGGFVVREIVDEDGVVTKLTALYRGPEGYNPSAGDFWFAVTDVAGNVAKSDRGEAQIGAVPNCSACHAARSGADFLFGVPEQSRSAIFAHPEIDSTPDEEAVVEAETTPQPTVTPEVTTAPEAAPEAEPEAEPEPVVVPEPAPIAPQIIEVVLANIQPENTREQSTTLSLDVSQPAVVVVARDATRSEFEAYWGALPAETVFINQGGVASFGAPIVNGGEVWEIRDASARVLDGPTVMGTVSKSYERTGVANDAWLQANSSVATPGIIATDLPRGIWISEWSDADEYEMEFVEISIR